MERLKDDADLLAAQAQELNEDGSEVLSEEPPSAAKKRIAAERNERSEKRKTAWRAEQAAKKAKKILVQVTMHTNGAPILEFATASPLVWPQKK